MCTPIFEYPVIFIMILDVIYYMNYYRWKKNETKK